MYKRRIILWLSGIPVAVVAIVGLVMVLTREREPEYAGKKLSEWVEGYATPPPMNLSRRTEEAAIRAIGTNALPYLLRWIRYETPAWKTKSIAFVNRVFRWTLVDHRLLRAHGAVKGLLSLEGEADGAVPDLAILMNDTGHPNTANRASMVMSHLLFKYAAPGRAALADMLTASDFSARIAATNALQKFSLEEMEKANRIGLEKAGRKTK